LSVGVNDPLVTQAAQALHLSPEIIAAQINEESRGDPNARSPAGALGEFQFLPSTYTGLGFPAGTETNPKIEVLAYIKYMGQLLAQEHGNVRNALAAYNAGPGNLSAGYGYADTILKNAGASAGTTAPGGTSGAGAGAGSGILSIPTDITNFFGEANKFVTALMWIAQPGSWLRIGAFFVAAILLIAALVVFTKADQKLPPPTIPIPVPV
jgi:hypothetical protein